MKITTKALLMVGLTLLSLTLILYFVLSNISLSGFQKLESEQANTNVERVTNAISSNIASLDAVTADWASWDDTYAFIEDANEGYREANLVPSTFEGLSLNLIVYINSSGQTVFASGFDRERGLTAVPEGLWPYLEGDSPLVHYSGVGDSTSGILLLPEGPMLVAARPILTSEDEGPIRGSLVFGRYLDSAMVASLSEVTQTELQVFRYDSPLAPAIAAARASLAEETVYVSPLNKEYVAGYTALADIYGQPALLLQVTMPRAIYAQGQASTLRLAMAIIAIGAAALILTLLLLDKQVLSRLASVTKGISRIGKAGDTSLRLTVKGSDELAGLGSAINDMLDAVHKSKQRLTESEEKLRLIFESANDILILVDTEGKILEVNSRVRDISGYEKEEFVGKNLDALSDTLGGDNIRLIKDCFKRRMAGVEVPAYEMEMRRKDGGRLNLEVSAVVIKKEANVIGALAILRDITEQKKAETLVRESERRYRLVTENATDVIWTTDASSPNRLTFVSPSVTRLLGYSVEEAMQKKMEEVFTEASFKRAMQAFQEEMAAEGERSQRPSVSRVLELELRRKDASIVSAEVNYSFIRGADGRPVEILAIVRDITERKRMQERLILTDRLASIGELASGLAHELNNPLTGVIGFSQLLSEKDLPEEARDFVNIISREAQRTAEIVKNLLTFARKHAPLKQLVDVKAVIKEVLEMRAYEQRVNNIQVVTHLAPDLPEVMADHFQLQQVFLNIVINAEYFMTEAHNKGNLTITAERDGKIIRISFADDGPGIAPESLRHIFDPFFTTKPVGKGTGLGLSICYGIISEHGGRIYAKSELGKGATFIIELPVSATNEPLSKTSKHDAHKAGAFPTS